MSRRKFRRNLATPVQACLCRTYTDGYNAAVADILYEALFPGTGLSKAKLAAKMAILHLKNVPPVTAPDYRRFATVFWR